MRRLVDYALASGGLLRPEPAPIPGPDAAAAPAADAAPEMTQPTAQDRMPTLNQGAFDSGSPRIAGLAPDDAYGATALRGVAPRCGGGRWRARRDLALPDQFRGSPRRWYGGSPPTTGARPPRGPNARLEQSDDPQAAQRLQALETVDTIGGPPFDAILLADGGDSLRSVAALLTFFDVDPATTRFLGTMRWQADPRVLAEGALQGGWPAAPAPDDLAAAREPLSRYLQAALFELAALAYDATALAVVVARDLGDRSFATTSLTDAEGFAGASGLFRLRLDGFDRARLAVLEVSGGTVRMLDPLPARFVDELAVSH